MTTDSSDNPILAPGFAIPFDRITAGQVEPAVAIALEQAEARLAAIENANPVTYETTLGALDSATELLEVAMTVVGHLEAVVSTTELRNAYNAVRPGVSGFYAGIPLRPKLFEVLSNFAATPEAAELPPSKKRFLKKTLDDFRRNGAGLDDAGKARLQAISRELAELTSRFSQNVLDATAEWELVIEDEAKLAGLPPSAIAAAKESAEKKGKAGYRFTLQAPSYMPLVTYLDDGSVRERIYRAYNARASSGPLDNGPLLGKIVELRSEQAKILGYGNFADLVLEDRMAQKGERARAFVADLTQRSEKAFAKETEELAKFRRSLPGDDGKPMEPWDVAYYSEKQRRALYDFDEEELRPYFPLDRAVEGLFETAQRLYGLRIEPNKKLPVWHADVTGYDIKDEDGTFLASFYADFFPREEKRGGAWMNAFRTGVSSNELHTPHLGLICANVTTPLGDKPALLTHQEVTTLFHEFGHLLHHCLSRVDVRSLAGTNVAWDFVELPSQIMENWCWERAALDTFARHHETGETIPDALFTKMMRARKYREASGMMRQLGFAAMDLALHVDYEPARDGAVIGYARRVMQPYAPAPFKDDYAMIAGFTHLFSSAVGYAAGYYSYKWAEVLDADAFTRFRQGGVFSRAVGNEFRRAILERGDSDDPATLYRSFMHREPSLDALLERAGLAITDGRAAAQ
ncbi:MAG TPA: M3 family metallopeptidase [Polyangiaceae bacterium]|nr:M3 family metallopeptidase [Polyangiaceae bacterium]